MPIFVFRLNLKLCGALIMAKKNFVQWTMLHAKRDFEIGYLTWYGVERAPLGLGWNVVLKAGTNFGCLIDARALEARVFKTLDAAVSAIEQIGFKVEGLEKR